MNNVYIYKQNKVKTNKFKKIKFVQWIKNVKKGIEN